MYTGEIYEADAAACRFHKRMLKIRARESPRSLENGATFMLIFFFGGGGLPFNIQYLYKDPDQTILDNNKNRNCLVKI